MADTKISANDLSRNLVPVGRRGLAGGIRSPADVAAARRLFVHSTTSSRGGAAPEPDRIRTRGVPSDKLHETRHNALRIKEQRSGTSPILSQGVEAATRLPMSPLIRRDDADVSIQIPPWAAAAAAAAVNVEPPSPIRSPNVSITRLPPVAGDYRSPQSQFISSTLAPLTALARRAPAGDSDVVILAASEGVVFYSAFHALDEDCDGWVRPGEVTRFVYINRLPYIAEADALDAFVTAAALADNPVDVNSHRSVGVAGAGGGLDYSRFVRVMRGDLSSAFRRLALALAQVHTARLRAPGGDVQGEEAEAVAVQASRNSGIGSADAETGAVNVGSESGVFIDLWGAPSDSLAALQANRGRDLVPIDAPSLCTHNLLPVTASADNVVAAGVASYSSNTAVASLPQSGHSQQSRPLESHTPGVRLAPVLSTTPRYSLPADGLVFGVPSPAQHMLHLPEEVASSGHNAAVRSLLEEAVTPAWAARAKADAVAVPPITPLADVVGYDDPDRDKKLRARSLPSAGTTEIALPEAAYAVALDLGITASSQQATRKRAPDDPAAAAAASLSSSSPLSDQHVPIAPASLLGHLMRDRPFATAADPAQVHRSGALAFPFAAAPHTFAMQVHHGGGALPKHPVASPSTATGLLSADALAGDEAPPPHTMTPADTAAVATSSLSPMLRPVSSASSRGRLSSSALVSHGTPLRPPSAPRDTASASSRRVVMRAQSASRLSRAVADATGGTVERQRDLQLAVETERERGWRYHRPRSRSGADASRARRQFLDRSDSEGDEGARAKARAGVGAASAITAASGSGITPFPFAAAEVNLDESTRLARPPSYSTLLRRERRTSQPPRTASAPGTPPIPPGAHFALLAQRDREMIRTSRHTGRLPRDWHLAVGSVETFAGGRLMRQRRHRSPSALQRQQQQRDGGQSVIPSGPEAWDERQVLPRHRHQDAAARSNAPGKASPARRAKSPQRAAAAAAVSPQMRAAARHLVKLLRYMRRCRLRKAFSSWMERTLRAVAAECASAELLRAAAAAGDSAVADSAPKRAATPPSSLGGGVAVASSSDPPPPSRAEEVQIDSGSVPPPTQDAPEEEGMPPVNVVPVESSGGYLQDQAAVSVAETFSRSPSTNNSTRPSTSSLAPPIRRYFTSSAVVPVEEKDRPRFLALRSSFSDASSRPDTAASSAAAATVAEQRSPTPGERMRAEKTMQASDSVARATAIVARVAALQDELDRIASSAVQATRVGHAAPLSVDEPLPKSSEPSSDDHHRPPEMTKSFGSDAFHPRSRHSSSSVGEDREEEPVSPIVLPWIPPVMGPVTVRGVLTPGATDRHADASEETDATHASTAVVPADGEERHAAASASARDVDMPRAPVPSLHVSNVEEAWMECVDDTNAQAPAVYFFNAVTGESAWELPPAAHSDETAPPCAECAAAAADRFCWDCVHEHMPDLPPAFALQDRAHSDWLAQHAARVTELHRALQPTGHTGAAHPTIAASALFGACYCAQCFALAHTRGGRKTPQHVFSLLCRPYSEVADGSVSGVHPQETPPRVEGSYVGSQADPVSRVRFSSVAEEASVEYHDNNSNARHGGAGVSRNSLGHRFVHAGGAGNSASGAASSEEAAVGITSVVTVNVSRVPTTDRSSSSKWGVASRSAADSAYAAAGSSQLRGADRHARLPPIRLIAMSSQHVLQAAPTELPGGPLQRMRQIQAERAAAASSRQRLGAATNTAGTSASDATGAASAPGVGELWQAYFDDARRAVYYRNPLTQETLWAPPQGPTVRIVPMTPAVTEYLHSVLATHGQRH